MEITVFRIDDRLIHGQIITAWLAYADAKHIMIADDKAAKDEFTQSLLKMATPDSIDLKIMTVADAVDFVNNDTECGKTLLLVRGTNEALQMVEGGVRPAQINVGNLNMKKGKTKVLSNMWVFPEDLDCFRKIDAAGVMCEVRAIPNDASQNVIELIKKL